MNTSRNFNQRSVVAVFILESDESERCIRFSPKDFAMSLIQQLSKQKTVAKIVCTAETWPINSVDQSKHFGVANFCHSSVVEPSVDL